MNVPRTLFNQLHRSIHAESSLNPSASPPLPGVGFAPLKASLRLATNFPGSRRKSSIFSHFSVKPITIHYNQPGARCRGRLLCLYLGIGNCIWYMKGHTRLLGRILWLCQIHPLTPILLSSVWSTWATVEPLPSVDSPGYALCLSRDTLKIDSKNNQKIRKIYNCRFVLNCATNRARPYKGLRLFRGMP